MGFFKPEIRHTVNSLFANAFEENTLSHIDQIWHSPITDLAYDPRSIIHHLPDQSGIAVFVSAAPFINMNGREINPNSLIFQAIDNGFNLILYRPDSLYPTSDLHYFQNALMIPVENPRAVLAKLAATYYGLDEKRRNIVGVTGTKGKTSTTYALHQLTNKFIGRCALVGSANYFIGEKLIDNLSYAINNTHLSCLESLELSGFIADSRCSEIVVETTSHALELERFSGDLSPIGCIITNLSSEHLDFHKTFDGYRQAKARILQHTANSASYIKPIVVLNADDPNFKYFVSVAEQFGIGDAITTVGYHDPVSPNSLVYSLTVNLNSVTFFHGGESHTIESQLRPSWYYLNHLFAIAFLNERLIQETGRSSFSELVSEIPSLQNVPGRFEYVGNSPTVVVDYAHEPLSVTSTLAFAAKHWNRVIVVFGLPGNRDRSSRPAVAKAVEKFASTIFITLDGPSNEPAEQIIGDIVTGFSPDTKFSVEQDRKRAIRNAVSVASTQENSIVLLLGRGEVTEMEISGVTSNWSDKDYVQQLLPGSHP